MKFLSGWLAVFIPQSSPMRRSAQRSRLPAVGAEILETRRLLSASGSVEYASAVVARTDSDSDAVPDRSTAETVLLPTTPAPNAESDANDETPAYDPLHILVRFREEAYRDGQTPPVVPGTTLVRAFQIVPGAYLVGLDQGMSVEEALAAYRAEPQVLYAEPNYRGRVIEPVGPKILLPAHAGRSDSDADQPAPSLSNGLEISVH